jgi:hypothetical protein
VIFLLNVCKTSMMLFGPSSTFETQSVKPLFPLGGKR